MNHRKILLLSALFLGVLFTIIFVKKRLESIILLTYAADNFPESNTYLHNPYEGFYQIYGYVLTDESPYDSVGEVPHIPSAEKQKENRLVQIQINLRNFSDRPLSENALQQLDMILRAWSRTDYSVILRILYDWDGRATEAEPDNIEQLMQHMEQTAGVYNRYADTILLIQGLSTGNTGEMHHTNYDSKESMSLLGQKLAEVSSPAIYLSVRTPSQWRSITGAGSYSELSAMPQNPFLDRLGLYNDGMFGSVSDTGTYTERSREEELAFQDELCRTVPNGGEAIIDNVYNDLDNAIHDMRTMHISYLNSGHDPAVITKWEESVYHGPDVFDGLSGFEYIRNHLGYRYVLRQSRLVPPSARNSATLLLTIENAGFSASYRRFSFALCLINSETGERFTLTPEYDSRDLPGNETTTLEIPLNGSDYPPAAYALYWQTTDDTSGEVIRYGNDLPLTEYGYRLGSLTIDAPYRRAER